MHLQTLLALLPALTLAAPSFPLTQRQTLTCQNLDLTIISDYLATTTSSLLSWTSIPDGAEPNAATRLRMRDDLVSRIKAEQPDTCVQDALTFAADEFFTDTSPAVLGRSLAVAEDLSERGLKISCRKCKKFIDRVIGTIVSSPILTPLVCGQIAAGVTAATTPVGGSIAGFVCLDQAERERRKLAAKGKVEQLRVSVGRFKPGMPKVEMRPESLAK